METMVGSRGLTGTSLLQHQWSGLKRTTKDGAATSSCAKPACLPAKACRMVRMTLVEEKKASVTTKSEEIFTAAKKSRGTTKSPKSQRVVLRFLWLEKNIGISLDQVVPGHGVVPLSPYSFWPRKDAWEELKSKLDSKAWISRKRTIILLNQATDIINLWQQNATGTL